MGQYQNIQIKAQGYCNCHLFGGTFFFFNESNSKELRAHIYTNSPWVCETGPRCTLDTAGLQIQKHCSHTAHKFYKNSIIEKILH